MARKLQVEIVGDASSLQRAFGKAGIAGNSLGRSIGRVSRVAAAGLAVLGAGATAAGGKMVALASDAAEVQSKMEVVFGKTLPKLTRNLDAFSRATGASRFELREQAADMGALLRPLTGSTEAAATMSAQFVKLASDLGSFNNVPTADALLAIRSGLVGEAEPLRRFGVLINDAAVKSEAYRLKLAKVGAELTEQQKVQARASLIMQQTTLAQGDATRTADSMANQMKRLRNTVTDVGTSMGQVLLPAALKVVGGLNDFIGKLGDAEGAGAKFRVVAQEIADRAGQVWRAIVAGAKAVDWGELATTIGEGLRGVGSRISEGVSEAFDKVDWSVTGRRIIDGLSDALEGAVELAQRMADTVMAGMRKIDWGQVGRIVGPGLATAIVVAFTTLLDPSFWVENWDLALAVAATVFRARIAAFAGKLLKAAVGPLTRFGGDMVLAIARAIESFSPRLATAFVTAVGVAVRGLAAAFGGLWAIVVRAARDAWGKLSGLLQKILVVGFVAAIAAAINAAVNAVASGATALWNAAKALAQGIIDKIVAILTKLPGQVISELGQIAGALVNAAATAATTAARIGDNIVTGVVSGLASLPRAVAEKTSEALTGLAATVRAELGKIASVMTDVGTTIYTAAVGVGEGIVRGIGAGLAGLVAGVTNAVQGIASAVGSLATQLIPSQDAVIGIWRKIQAAIQGFLNWFRQTFLSGVQAVVGAVTGIWTQFGTDMVRIVTAGFNAVRTVVSTVLGDISRVIRGLLTTIQGVWSEAWNTIKEIPGRALREAAGVIRGLVGTFLTAATAIGTAVVTGVTTGLNTLLGKVKEKLGLIQGAISTVAGNAAGWAGAIGRAIVSGVLSGISSLPGQLADKLGGYVKGAIDRAGGLLSGSGPWQFTIHAVGKPLAEGVLIGVVQGLAGLGSTLAEKVRTGVNVASAAARTAARAGNDMGQSIIEGVSQTLGRLPNSMGNSVRAALDAAAKAAKAGRSAWASAWADYASDALSTFDKIAGKVRTTSEQILDTMRATRAQSEINVAVTQAQTGLDTAKASGDTEAILAAQKTFDDALYRQKEFALEQQALLERAAFDAKTATDRGRFEQWLGTRTIQQQQELTQEGKGQKAIVARIESYSNAYKTAGKQLGDNLAAGMRDARGNVVDAANELAAAMAGALNVQWRPVVETAITQTRGKFAGLAEGGIVKRPTFALIGEAGPEVVIPLNQFGRGGGDVYIEVNAPNFYGDKTELGRVVRSALADVARDNPNIFAGRA